MAPIASLNRNRPVIWNIVPKGIENHELHNTIINVSMEIYM